MNTAFWDIAPCSLVEVDQHFRSAYCLHHHPDEGSTHLCNVGLLQQDYIYGAISQKSVI
jgi:hypothetical protein